jgi:hypothetical protein
LVDVTHYSGEHPGNGIDGNRGMIGGIDGGISPNKSSKAIKVPSTASGDCTDFVSRAPTLIL